MSRYFFDVWDGRELVSDLTGLDLADMDAAVAEGRRALASMAKDAIDGGDGGGELIEIRIRDGDEGPVMLKVRLDVIRPANDDPS